MSVRDTSIDPRLLKSAREEFMEHGFLKADLKTICDNAGVTTGAVYKRYKGKEELFCAVVEHASEILDEFIESRTGIDFSKMSDDDIKSSWVMSEKYILEMFRLLWDIREDLVLLLDKSAGTSYENYGHEFALRMTDAYMEYYNEAKKRGLAKAKITRAEMHVLCSAFWTAIYEPFVHDMPWKEVEAHCKILSRYFNWAGAISME